MVMTLEQIAHSRRLWLLAGLVMLSTGLLLSVWHPSDRIEHSICFMRRVFEVPCPGCGLTRGFAALAKWDFAAAVAAHPLSPLFALEALAAWLFWGRVSWLRTPMLTTASLNAMLLVQVVLLLTVWGVRLTAGSFGG